MSHATLSVLKQQLKARRQSAAHKYRSSIDVDTLLKTLRRICDQVIRKLLRLYPLPEGATLVAIGGYGRGELYPYSDIDILILLSAAPDKSARQRIERLLAAMWDIGLAPSHHVAQTGQCLELAAQDITFQTALLESRYLQGSRPLLRSLQQQVNAALNPQAFFTAKRQEQLQRHAHYHDTPYALEPNCKESPGALRDLQVLLWLARAAGLGNSWRDIARSGELTLIEQRALLRVAQAFRRLRIELHLLSGRAEDRVLFDLQPALAEIYGFQSTPTRRGSEILMQRYYWAARGVTQLNLILMQSIQERLFPHTDSATLIDTHFQARKNRLELRPGYDFSRQPELIFEAFLVLQTQPQLDGMSAPTLRSLWHARRVVDANFRQNPHHKQQFIKLLQQRQGIVHSLRLMSMMNILPRYLPPFRRIVGQMQHDLFHAYTVDEHTLKVIRNLRRFTMAEHSHEFGLAHQLIGQYERHWLLYIAALFHDIAKGRGGNHSELGAEDALVFCQEHALSGEDTELIVFLVREHLSMSLYAQKRDLSDPAVIFDFTRIVGTERRLTALYLLTVADICATSPTVWNSWKGKLLEDLYNLSLAVLHRQPGDSDTVLTQRKHEAASEIRLLGLLDETRDQFWNLLEEDYFLRYEAHDIAWHTQQLYFRHDSPTPVVKIRLAGHSDAIQVLVYTPDTEGLFLAMCRYFDAQGLSIQDARIYTTKPGWALDTFVVLLPDYEHSLALDPYLIEQELPQHLSERCGTTYRNSHYQEAGSRRARVFPITPSAELLALPDHQDWQLAITATDRRGLLYSLALVFEHHNINVKSAKVMTLGDRVEDIFQLSGTDLAQKTAQTALINDILAALGKPSN